MKISVVLHSLSYVISLCGSMVVQKVFNYFYGYNDYWLTVVLYSIFAPLNIVPFLYFAWNISLDRRIWIKFFIPAVIYALETILLSLTLNQMELGLYIIARTSYSIFNYFTYRYILHRQLNIYYYIGIGLLLLSYVFILLDYSTSGSTMGMIMFGLCLATGASTSFYNTLAEMQLTQVKENKLAYTLVNNVIFQMTAFTINLPIALPQIQPDPVMFTPSFVVLAILSALGFQVYSINKFFILNDADVNGSMIVSSLDLLRRIIINTVSYTALSEQITVLNMIGNGILVAASFSLFYSSNGKDAGARQTDTSDPSGEIELQESTDEVADCREQEIDLCQVVALDQAVGDVELGSADPTTEDLSSRREKKEEEETRRTWLRAVSTRTLHKFVSGRNI